MAARRCGLFYAPCRNHWRRVGENSRILQLAGSNKNNELLMRLLALSLLLSVSVPAFAADSGELQNRLDNTVKPFVAVSYTHLLAASYVDLGSGLVGIRSRR